MIIHRCHFEVNHLMFFLCKSTIKGLRRVWRYQRGNQNPYIEDNTIQTTQYRQHNSHKKEDNRTNNDLQNIHT